MGQRSTRALASAHMCPSSHCLLPRVLVPQAPLCSLQLSLVPGRTLCPTESWDRAWHQPSPTWAGSTTAHLVGDWPEATSQWGQDPNPGTKHILGWKFQEPNPGTKHILGWKFKDPRTSPICQGLEPWTRGKEMPGLISPHPTPIWGVCLRPASGRREDLGGGTGQLSGSRERVCPRWWGRAPQCL